MVFLIALQEVRCSLHGIEMLENPFVAFFLFCFVEATGLNGSIGAGEIHGSKEFRNKLLYTYMYIYISIYIYRESKRHKLQRSRSTQNSH